MVKIRQATKSDLSVLADFWMTLLESLVPKGGDVRPTPRSVAFYMELFEEVIEGRPGVGIVAQDGEVMVGGLLAVSAPLPWDSTLGRCAAGFGTFVLPSWQKIGVASKLYESAERILRAQGFDSYLGAYHLENESGKRLLRSRGAYDLQVATVIPLRKDPQ